jgi:hypothetical protein
LQPKNLEKNIPINENLVEIIEQSDKTEMKKYMLFRRWIERDTYEDIIAAVDREFNVEISRRQVRKITKKDPREWGRNDER